MTLASRSDCFDGTIVDNNSSTEDCRDVTKFSLGLGHLNEVRLNNDDETFVELYGRQNNGFTQNHVENSPNTRIGDEVIFQLNGQEFNFNITNVKTQGGEGEDEEEKKVPTRPTECPHLEKSTSPRLIILIKRHSKVLICTTGILLLICIVTLTTLYMLAASGDIPPPPSTTITPSGTTTTTTTTTTRPHILHYIFTRNNWGARDPAEKLPSLKIPVSLVVIKHTNTDICVNVNECFTAMKDLQNYDVGVENLPDIRYNFVIGANWNVYEGRGWYEQNSQRNDSIDIAFMGNYSAIIPGAITVATGPWLIEKGVSDGFLDANVKVVCHNQTESVDSPGEFLYREVVRWKYYSDEIIGN